MASPHTLKATAWDAALFTAMVIPQRIRSLDHYLFFPVMAGFWWLVAKENFASSR